jgi:hypothetical protein
MYKFLTLTILGLLLGACAEKPSPLVPLDALVASPALFEGRALRVEGTLAHWASPPHSWLEAPSGQRLALIPAPSHPAGTFGVAEGRFVYDRDRGRRLENAQFTQERPHAPPTR